MAREITRLTWPLPWWIVAIPAAVIAVVSYIGVNQASAWAYISSARLSGMPSEALIVAGPIACISAAWIAERFTNRNFPLASPTVVRASGAHGLRILAVLVGAWAMAHVLGAMTSIAVQLARATGGTFHPIEVLLSVFALTFFVVTGFTIGAVIARWHAPLWAALWSFLWALAFPLYYPDISLGSGTNIEYFMFPALPSIDHRSLSLGVMTVLVVWWIVVLGSLTALVYGWYRRVARESGTTLVGSGVAVAAVAVVGFVIPVAVPSPFVDGEPMALSCTQGRHMDICVTEEQQEVLDEVVPRVDTVLDRMGAHLPEGLKAVVSDYGLSAAEADGLDDSEILVMNVGTGGMPTIEFDVALSLAGLPACDPDTSNSTAVSWAFAFGQWLAPEGDYLLQTDPMLAELDQAEPEDVLAWYTTNQDELRACTYTGNGPK